MSKFHKGIFISKIRDSMISVSGDYINNILLNDCEDSRNCMTHENIEILEDLIDCALKGFSQKVYSSILPNQLEIEKKEMWEKLKELANNYYKTGEII